MAAADQRPAEFAREATRQAENPFAVGREQIAIDPGLEVKAFQIRLGGQLQQVGEALLVLGQKREVVARILLVAGVFLKPTTRGDIGFVANDRIEPRSLCRTIKLKRTVQVAVVGDGQRVHAEFDGAADKPLDRTRSVEQAVVAVAVEVDERPAHVRARFR